VKNATACAKKLTSLLKKLETPPEADAGVGDDPVAVLVMSFLMWQATSDKAAAAFDRLSDATVDFNDLRVTLPHEIVDLIGPRYPMALERAERLRTVLRDVFMREHAVKLDRLRDVGKRDVKKHIESLDGILPYVAARIMLLSFQVHAVPVDDHLRQLLIEAGAADESADVAELSSWLARQIKAEEGIAAHAKLQAWADREQGKSRGAARKRKKTTATARKTSTQKTTRKRTRKQPAGK
jgi:endonuclease III